MFPPIRYLEWMWEQEAEHDLGSSGLGGREDGVIPERLQGLPDPPAGTDLEAQIAAQYDETVSPENVLVTAGTTHANVLAFATAFERTAPGAPGLGQVSGGPPTVVVEEPGYEPLASTPAGLGADIRRVERPESGGYALEPDAVRSVADDTTAMVVVSNRHNPSGQLADRETLANLAGAAQAHGSLLLVDEVYAPYLPEPRQGPGTAFGGPTAAGLEGAVVTNSLTKFFGFGGLRIGWLVAEASFVEAARSVSAHLPDVAGPSRALARRAFNNLDRIVEGSRERVAANASRLDAFVETRPDLHGPVAEGSTFGFPGHESADGDAVTAAASEAGILVVPGRFFGDRSRFRLSLSDSPAAMDAALDRFGAVLDELSDS